MREVKKITNNEIEGVFLLIDTPNKNGLIYPKEVIEKALVDFKNQATKKVKKYISTGGVGDLFIVGLKLQELVKQDPKENIDWLHVESSDIAKTAENIFEFFPILKNVVEFRFEHDANYIQNFLNGKWKDRESIPVSFNRECKLHKIKWEIDNPFLEEKRQASIFDVVVQVSAGQKNNKQWFFNVVQLAKSLVRNFEYRVCLIGNDSKFKTNEWCIEPGLTNEVCKWKDLNEAVQIINKCKLMIGLGGFLNFYASSIKTPNVYLIEGPEQEIDYYSHKKWKDLTFGIQHPSLSEVMRAINHFRGVGIL